MRQQPAEPHQELHDALADRAVTYALRSYCRLSVCCYLNVETVLLYELNFHNLADCFTFNSFQVLC